MIVLVRRESDCAMRGRLDVDLEKTGGVVRFTGRLQGDRLARGVYVLTLWREHGTSPLRRIVVRVTKQGRVVRLHRPAEFCLGEGSGKADTVALLSGGVPGAGVGVGPARRGEVSKAASPAANKKPAENATAGANTFHLATPRVLADAAGDSVVGMILAILILALLIACPVAIVIYVWRFVHTPAAS